MAAAQPAWSPDGTRIITEGAFDEGRNAVIEVRTGRVGAKFDGLAPGWAGDGRLVYHGSVGPDERTIWKLDLETGEGQKLVTGGKPRESSDGRRLYYTQVTELMAVPLDAAGVAGEPERIAQDGRSFCVVSGGVYYRTRSEVYKYSEESGQTVLVTTLPESAASLGGLTVLPDERWLAYTRQVSSASDVWMLESVE